MAEVIIETTNTPGGDKILGKFESQEELVKAYQALESKLGAGTNGQQTETTAGDTPGTTEATTETTTGTDTTTTETTTDSAESPYGPTIVEGLKAQGLEVDAVVAEFNSEAGITADTRAKMDAAFGKQAVDAYLAGVTAQNAETAEVADQISKDIVGIAGGEDNWQKLAGWVGGPEGDKDLADAFDAAIDRNDAATLKALATAIKVQYESKKGSLSVNSVKDGAPPVASGATAFRSKQEWIEAVQDPRYATDSAYRDDVAKRVAKTDLKFSA